MFIFTLIACSCILTCVAAYHSKGVIIVQSTYIKLVVIPMFIIGLGAKQKVYDMEIGW